VLDNIEKGFEPDTHIRTYIISAELIEVKMEMFDLHPFCCEAVM